MKGSQSKKEDQISKIKNEDHSKKHLKRRMAVMQRQIGV